MLVIGAAGLLLVGLAVMLWLPEKYALELHSLATRFGVPGVTSDLADRGDAASSTSAASPEDPDPSPANAAAAGPAPAPPPMITGDYPGIPDNFDYYEPDLLGEPFSKSQEHPFRTDKLEIRLGRFEQVEYKASLRRGDVIVYGWSVDHGAVYADFQGTPTGTASGR